MFLNNTEGTVSIAINDKNYTLCGTFLPQNVSAYLQPLLRSAPRKQIR